ncbi:MAG TPA: hypothetical protein VGB34_06780 [Candidatus Limnocylindria bacterium]|jgi:hypothetical protein
MTPKRSPRSLTTVWLALVVALAALAGPAMTLAATPNWTGSLEALPPVVSSGAVAGYRATITNPGPSNVSQLSVTAAFSQPYVAASLPDTGPDPVHVKLVKDGVTLADACGEDPLDGPVSCTVGALNAGSTAVLVVAYQTSGTAAAGVTVRWTTTGLGSGGGDNSHGDVLNQFFTEANPPTSFNPSANFDGGFTEEPDESFATSGPFSASNLFTTSFTTEDAFVPVMVQDDTTAAFATCPEGETCYGQPTQDAILLSINEGEPFDALTPFTIKVLKDAVPKGSNVSRVVVVHYFDPGSFDPDTEPAYELISNDCPKNATPTGTCRTVSWDGKTGIWTIVVYLEENGVIKFH